jgi:beta-glucosidase
MNSPFPESFLWGAASAATQIEGSPAADGRGPSIWDMFARKQGAISGGATPDVACDFYHRWPEDVKLMRDLGLKAYRFSPSWSRILPHGTGPVNQAGLDFYSRLTDALLEGGIEPMLTLYHWDLPLDLHHRGGWLNRDITSWFADYAGIVGRALGDRVKWWCTLNEPQVFVVGGYRDGNHAPGLKLSIAEGLRCVHHALLAHGTGTQALRTACPHPVKIGFAPAGYGRIPETDSPTDINAARHSLFTVSGTTLWDLALYTDPVYLGRYPEECLRIFGPDWHHPSAEDMKTIHQPVDFIGFNAYAALRTRAKSATGSAPAGSPGYTLGGGAGAMNSAPEDLPYPQEHPTGTLPWLLVAPDTLYWLARFYDERYGHGKIPLIVTENGFCSTDWVALDGGIHDGARIDYLHRYLRGLKRAAAEGLPVAGYFHWTLTDNFDWAEGCKPRFGLIHIDYPTQQRTLKDSALWYRDVIATNGAEL